MSHGRNAIRISKARLQPVRFPAWCGWNSYAAASGMSVIKLNFQFHLPNLWLFSHCCLKVFRECIQVFGCISWRKTPLRRPKHRWNGSIWIAVKVIQWKGVNKIQMDQIFGSSTKWLRATRPRTSDPQSDFVYDLRVLTPRTNTGFKESVFYLCQTLTHVWGSGCRNPHFLDLGTLWRWMVSFTPRRSPADVAGYRNVEWEDDGMMNYEDNERKRSDLM